MYFLQLAEDYMQYAFMSLSQQLDNHRISESFSLADSRTYNEMLVSVYRVSSAFIDIAAHGEKPVVLRFAKHFSVVVSIIADGILLLAERSPVFVVGIRH